MWFIEWLHTFATVQLAAPKNNTCPCMYTVGSCISCFHGHWLELNPGPQGARKIRLHLCLSPDWEPVPILSSDWTNVPELDWSGAAGLGASEINTLDIASPHSPSSTLRNLDSLVQRCTGFLCAYNGCPTCSEDRGNLDVSHPACLAQLLMLCILCGKCAPILEPVLLAVLFCMLV